MSDIENHFKADAKTVVDTLYDNACLNVNLTRDSMNAIEELISYMMSSRYESQRKAEKIMEKYKSKA